MGALLSNPPGKPADERTAFGSQPRTAKQKAKAARDAVAALARWKKAAGVKGSASEFTPPLVELRLE
jgi:hypothetical protein